MITNLLDKTVKGTSTNSVPVIGKICAVFHEGINGFCVAVINNEDGKIHTCYSNCISMYNEQKFSVVLMANMPAQKILAIKIIRYITDMGLKEAKDYVEANPNRIFVKQNVSYDEATAIQNRVKEHGMDSAIQYSIDSITQE